MTQKQRKPKERKITDVQAIKEFYRAMQPRSYSAKMAAVTWLMQRFTADENVSR